MKRSLWGLCLAAMLAFFVIAGCGKPKQDQDKDKPQDKTQLDDARIETAKPTESVQTPPRPPDLPPPPPPLPQIGVKRSDLAATAKAACDAIMKHDMHAMADIMFPRQMINAFVVEIRAYMAETADDLREQLKDADDEEKEWIEKKLSVYDAVKDIEDDKEFFIKILEEEFTDFEDMAKCEIASTTVEPCSVDDMESFKEYGIDVEECGRAAFAMSDKEGEVDEDDIMAIKVKGKWYFPER